MWVFLSEIGNWGGGGGGGGGGGCLAVKFLSAGVLSWIQLFGLLS